MKDKKHWTPTHFCVYFVCASFIFILLCVYTGQPLEKPMQSSLLPVLEITESDYWAWISLSTTNPFENQSIEYLVESLKCKIPSLNPYSVEAKTFFKPKEYIPCSKLEPLTYISKMDRISTLHIAKDVIPSYSSYGVRCCYSTVWRGTEESETPDDLINVSDCTYFEDEVTITSDTVLVSCRHRLLFTEVYKNIHASIVQKRTVNEKTGKYKYKQYQHLSVLMLGIDSVSRLNFIRQMKQTRSFLQENEWIEMEGYSKIGENTFPNLMGILTGKNDSVVFDKCNPTKLGNLEKCGIIWQDYNQLNYITAYFEDEASINTFNYLKTGFVHEPTDYYFRPYVLTAEKYLNPILMDHMTYCIGPETYGERVLNIAKDFATTYKELPSFGFFWMNTFSHNELNSVSRMDGKFLEFLEDLFRNGAIENSVVIFFSDHGLRFGDFRYTQSGYLEERLPFFFISLPKWFKRKFSKEFHNLAANRNRLTTPYDLYMTLQHILVLSGQHYTISPSSACPQCKSLFQPAEEQRSCVDAGVQAQWCTCSSSIGSQVIPTNNSIVQQAVDFSFSEIKRSMRSSGSEAMLCVDYQVKSVISSRISKKDNDWSSNDTYLVIVFKTTPTAVFEATLSVLMYDRTPSFKLEGRLSRLDESHTHTMCVSEPILKSYCYCDKGALFVLRYVFVTIKKWAQNLL